MKYLFALLIALFAAMGANAQNRVQCHSQNTFLTVKLTQVDGVVEAEIIDIKKVEHAVKYPVILPATGEGTVLFTVSDRNGEPYVVSIPDPFTEHVEYIASDEDGKPTLAHTTITHNEVYLTVKVPFRCTGANKVKIEREGKSHKMKTLQRAKKVKYTNQ